MFIIISFSVLSTPTVEWFDLNVRIVGVKEVEAYLFRK